MYIDSELERYIEAHTEPEPPVLMELRRETHLRVMRPRMLSGNQQGQFLKMICKMARAKRILEIGTYTGYAAISMAEGLSDGGFLYTIDINDELEDIVHKYIAKSGLQEKIRFIVGDACEVIPTLNEQFDVVFIDADKRHYLEYYQLVFDRICPGGIILVDDVLWDGKVLDEVSVDAQTQGIMMFNDYILKDKRVEKVLLPVRHGIMMIRKK